MIVLDTNVVSELLREARSPAVVHWVNQLPASATFITAITKAELLYGVGLMPAGRRRNELEQAIAMVLGRHFAGRVLPFDSEAAEHFPRIVLRRRGVGRPIEQPDAQIASIALAQGAELATRNVRDFSDTGLTLIDPWSAGG